LKGHPVAKLFRGHVPALADTMPERWLPPDPPVAFEADRTVLVAGPACAHDVHLQDGECTTEISSDRRAQHTRRTRPDLLLMLSLNVVHELAEEMAYARERRCELVVPSPEVAVLG
jgi:hypothetical protein